MFLLMTIIFIALTIRIIFLGPIMRNTLNEINLANHLKKVNNTSVPKDIEAKAGAVITFGLFMVVINLIYFIYAYDVDQLRWPTLVMLLVFILRLIFTRIDNEIEYKPIQRCSVMIILRNLIFLAYYGYILSSLV
ncbi:hypothetical protein SPSIL_008750 [Sporomusa silvacetica DSM 10669]|uniref:Uncharacterized protein n=1 Tax=Sporomusa silvacetica DSM 10669 TaxID=1123289 RepID=A0ABZ3IGH9_9FIRM|nr:hypothetical protein SPSIL_56210 [Sporomusa silvacetica DSM 10669]